MSENTTQGAKTYMEAVMAILDRIAQTQGDAIAKAADAITQAIANDGMVYLFGSGHSHMLAEEGHYRAGGLAPVCPMLFSNLMLHESAILSSAMERLPGLGGKLLDRYEPRPGDVLVVFSNSGVNAVPVELARDARQRGLTVIGVVSLEYSTQAPNPLGVKLPEVADIVIDNCGPPGDALVDMGGGVKVAPYSTVAGAFIWNSIVAEVSVRLATQGLTVPAYRSSNMPGAAEHNADMLAKYKKRNPHL